MRSFAEFQQEKLKSGIYGVTFAEGICRQFEILRLDLDKALGLPDLEIRSQYLSKKYHAAKQQDFLESRNIARALVEYFQNRCLVLTEDAAPSMEREVKAKIKDLVADLKANVLHSIGQNRSTTEPKTGGAKGSPEDPIEAEVDEPVGPSAAPASRNGTPASSPEITPHASPTTRTATRTHASGVPLAPPRSSGGTPPVRAHAGVPPVRTNPASGRTAYDGPEIGSARPAQNGFQPAKYGDMLPSDGLFGGLGRMIGYPWRMLTQPIRRLWHNDPTREQVELIERALGDNLAQLDAVFDKFEKDLTVYVTDRLQAVTGGKPQVPGVAAPGTVPTASIGATNMNKAVQGTDPDVVDPNKETALDRRVAGGDEVAAVQQKDHWDNLDIALKTLGMGHNYSRGWKGNKISKKKILIDGQPLAQVAPGELAKRVFKGIYVKVLGRPENDPYLQTKGLSKKVIKEVGRYLGGLQAESQRQLSGILEVLLKLGKKLRSGSGTTPTSPTATDVGAGKTAPVLAQPGAKNPGATAPISAGQTNAGTAKQATATGPVSASWPTDYVAFANKMAEEHPDEYKTLLGLVDGGENGLLATLKTGLRDYKDNPDGLAKAILDTAKDHVATQSSTVEPTKATGPAPDNVQTIKQIIADEAKDPKNGDIAQMLNTSNISDEELAKLTAGKNLSDPDVAEEVILTVIQRNSRGTTKAEAPVAPKAGSMRDIMANRGKQPETVPTDRSKAEVEPAKGSAASTDPMDDLLNSEDYWRIIKNIKFQYGKTLDDDEIKGRMADIEQSAQDIVRDGGTVEDALAKLKSIFDEAKSGGSGEKHVAQTTGLSKVRPPAEEKKESVSEKIGRFRKFLNG